MKNLTAILLRRLRIKSHNLKISLADLLLQQKLVHESYDGALDLSQQQFHHLLEMLQLCRFFFYNALQPRFEIQAQLFLFQDLCFE